MTVYKSLALILTTLITATGCISQSISGEGPMQTTEYQLSDVRAVSISGSGDVHVIQSDAPRLIIHAQQNVLDSLIIDIDPDSLDIEQRPGTHLSFGTELTYDIYVSDLDRLRLSGSVDVQTDDFHTERLHVSSSGSSEGVLRGLDIGILELSSSGSSNFDLSGEASELSISSSGSTDIDAADLRTSIVSIDGSGSNDIRVWAIERLSIDASGSTDIRYRGQPVIEQQSISGSATIQSLNGAY